METARQPAQEMATNLTPPPIAEDRQKISYHEKQEKALIDKLVLAVVGLLALTIIALSFHNTAALAKVLKLNPKLAACLVEMLFGSLLFIRARQRALQRNVPHFLEIGYFCSLAFVTAVNMWGLGQIHNTGYVVGAAVTGAMWLMENTLVWLWTDSHRPHEKSVREMQREVRKEIKRTRALQWIAWRRHEGKKPDLALVKKARKAEDNRRKVVENGLPDFFQTQANRIKTNNQTNEQIKQTSDKQDQPEQTKQTTNKQDNIKQTKQTAEQTPDKQTNQTNKTPNKQDNTEQTPNIKHRTDKQIQTEEPNTQGEQTPNTERQTDKQDLSKQTESAEQTNNRQAPDKHQTDKDEQKDNQTNKVIYINKQTVERTNTSNKKGKQTDNEQQAERTDKQQTIKQVQRKRASKQTANVPSYEQLLEMIDQTFAANKKLPTVRAFAEQANIKPNRAHTALKMWKEANGQTVAKTQTANSKH